jgi:hypothetical protein
LTPDLIEQVPLVTQLILRSKKSFTKNYTTKITSQSDYNDLGKNNSFIDENAEVQCYGIRNLKTNDLILNEYSTTKHLKLKSKMHMLAIIKCFPNLTSLEI